MTSLWLRNRLPKHRFRRRSEHPERERKYPKSRTSPVRHRDRPQKIRPLFHSIRRFPSEILQDAKPSSKNHELKSQETHGRFYSQKESEVWTFKDHQLELRSPMYSWNRLRKTTGSKNAVSHICFSNQFWYPVNPEMRLFQNLSSYAK